MNTPCATWERELIFYLDILNRPWSNIGTAHRLIIANISGKLYVNPTMGLKNKEQTQNMYSHTMVNRPSSSHSPKRRKKVRAFLTEK